MNVVEVGRMRQLADFLETVPPKDFDLRAWQTRCPIAPTMLGPFAWGGCGFAGCALGWAAHSGLFLGLGVDRQGNLVYKGFANYRAVRHLLGIKQRAAWFLFGQEMYDREAQEPGDVAARIRRFADIVERRRNRGQVEYGFNQDPIDAAETECSYALQEAA